MPRTQVTLTDTYQVIATRRCVITVQAVPGARALSLNQTASDLTALRDVVSSGDQFAQNETKDTYAKGEGIILVIDQEG